MCFSECCFSVVIAAPLFYLIQLCFFFCLFVFFETYVVGMRNSIARRMENTNNNNKNSNNSDNTTKKKNTGKSGFIGATIQYCGDLHQSPTVLPFTYIILYTTIFTLFSTDQITLWLCCFSQSVSQSVDRITFNNKIIIPSRVMVTFNLNRNIA